MRAPMCIVVAGNRYPLPTFQRFELDGKPRDTPNVVTIRTVSSRYFLWIRGSAAARPPAGASLSHRNAPDPFRQSA